MLTKGHYPKTHNLQSYQDNENRGNKDLCVWYAGVQASSVLVFRMHPKRTHDHLLVPSIFPVPFAAPEQGHWTSYYVRTRLQPAWDDTRGGICGASQAVTTNPTELHAQVNACVVVPLITCLGLHACDPSCGITGGSL